jgi:hypothetical protein
MWQIVRAARDVSRIVARFRTHSEWVVAPSHTPGVLRQGESWIRIAWRLQVQLVFPTGTGFAIQTSEVISI